jgi:hypothetical protein
MDEYSARHLLPQDLLPGEAYCAPVKLDPTEYGCEHDDYERDFYIDKQILTWFCSNCKLTTGHMPLAERR